MRCQQRRLPVLTALIVALLCPKSFSAIAAESYLNQAEKSFRSGRYSDALVSYLKAGEDDRVAGIVGAIRTHILTGQYAAAEKICRESLKELPRAIEIISELAEILALTGRSDEAIGLLAQAASGPDATNRILVQYGKLLTLRGRSTEADSYFRRAVANYNDGKIWQAEDIAMAAAASRALESYHDANRLFQEALQMDPENLEAQVLWGDLFQEKHNSAEARISYGKALEQNPRYVPALVGMAKISGGHEAEKILRDALEINPYDVSALETLARMSIEDDRFETAAGYLEKIFRINPEALNAKMLSASVSYLKDDRKTYDRIRRWVEAFSPGISWFYTEIAEICGRKYRFAEAVELARQAVAIDSKNWSAYAVLGANLLRLGNEEEGRTNLEHGFKQDPFNFLALNLLEVLDTLDGFETRRTDRFIVRMAKADADILWPYLEPLLEESWDTLTKRYDFTPQGPVLIEIFDKHEDFSARTLGLPDIGPLVGVCFGGVVTMDSPGAFKPPGSLNWQEILWHEFTHVITLQMTRNRMPRWLSEGISVFEERQGRPEWGRKQDLELIKAVEEGRMLPIRQLNEGFSRAQTHEDVGFAYYQSSLVVEYIMARYGFEALKNLIQGYASETEMEPIFRKAFNESLDSFEAGFSTWTNDRVRRLNVYVHPEDSGQTVRSFSGGNGFPAEAVETLKKRISENPRDFSAHFRLGMIFYQRKEFEEAVNHLRSAGDLIPEYAENPNPRLILADIYEQQGEGTAMERELEALVKYHQHALDACIKLARLAYNRKDYDRSAYYLERAIAVNPYDVDTHKLFAAIAMEKAAYETAVREYRVLLALDTTDPVQAHTDLADAWMRAGKKQQARESALSALEIAPTFERAQTILLESLEP
ncbi:MAG: hypothetical protein C4530_04405 [Desulfobacteraceae bacterium]|nr:MAG: hypothetical protein C4530_04405 [Desulfobacteraceae bacterium]